MKVALVGCAPTWRTAPYDDPSWTIWAHASCQQLHLPRVHRWFDIHALSVWRQGKVWYRPEGDEPPTYVDWLASRLEPVVMQQHWPVVPASVPYPLRALVEAFGIVPAEWVVDEATWWRLVRDRGEFSSTAAYMLALALYEGATEIALHGIDFIGQDTRGIERTYQRPGMKYWVGVARGMGVPVTVAPGSWFQSQPFLYGYEPTPEEVSV